MLKEPPVGAFQQIQDENSFSTPRLSAYRRRMGRLWQEVMDRGQFQNSYQHDAMFVPKVEIESRSTLRRGKKRKKF